MDTFGSASLVPHNLRDLFLGGTERPMLCQIPDPRVSKTSQTKPWFSRGMYTPLEPFFLSVCGSFLFTWGDGIQKSASTKFLQKSQINLAAAHLQGLRKHALHLTTPAGHGEDRKASTAPQLGLSQRLSSVTDEGTATHLACVDPHRTK